MITGIGRRDVPGEDADSDSAAVPHVCSLVEDLRAHPGCFDTLAGDRAARGIIVRLKYTGRQQKAPPIQET